MVRAAQFTVVPAFCIMYARTGAFTGKLMLTIDPRMGALSTSRTTTRKPEWPSTVGTRAPDDVPTITGSVTLNLGSGTAAAAGGAVVPSAASAVRANHAK